MDGIKRHRVELDPYSYEVLRYFGLLRGVPIGRVMRRALYAFAQGVVEEFPPIKAHMVALAAAEASGTHEQYKTVDMVPF